MIVLLKSADLGIASRQDIPRWVTIVREGKEALKPRRGLAFDRGMDLVFGLTLFLSVVRLFARRTFPVSCLADSHLFTSNKVTNELLVSFFPWSQVFGMVCLPAR